MNKKTLSLLISVSLSTTTFELQARECPELPGELSVEEIKNIPVKCLERNDSISSVWWWVAGGVAVAAGAGVALAGGGGGGGGGGGDDDFDDYDDYVEYFYNHGFWPAGTPQSVIDAWNASHSGPGAGTSKGNDSFSSHVSNGNVSAINYNDSNGSMVIDVNSNSSGTNTYAVKMTGNSNTISQNTGITTTARNNASAINVNGRNNTVKLSGISVADGNDATVLDIEGSANQVFLSSGSKTHITNGGDALDIEGYGNTVRHAGFMSVSGADSTGIHMDSNSGSLTVEEGASITVSAPVNYSHNNDVYATGIDIRGDNFTLSQESSNFTVGTNSYGIKVEDGTSGSVMQKGQMTVAGTNATGIWLESERNAAITATNSGTIKSNDNATAMHAQGAGASVVNTGEIEVRNSGVAMSVANGATAVNRGVITLTSDSGAATGTLTAMKSTGNATLINDTTGIINLNAQGATPFSATSGNSVVNNGKIYSGGTDVTQSYAINNYTIGTTNAGQSGVLYTSNSTMENVNINTGFSEHSAAKSVTFEDVIVGNNLRGEENIRSTSVVWKAEGQKDAQGNIDVVMKKQAYDQVIGDTSLTRAAQSLEKGYTNNALYSSLNQTSSSGLDEAIRQISGQNIGLAQMQARTLDYRFNQLASSALKNPTGLGFNAVSRDSLQGELDQSSRYDMLALSQDFSAGIHRFTLSYGIARLDGETQNTSDSITGGYSQFVGLQHQQSFGEWQWQNQFDASFHQLETTRHIRYAGVDYRADAHNEQQQFTLTSTVSKKLAWENGFDLQPFFGMRARYHHMNALREQNAGAWNLNLDARDKTVVDALAGIHLNWTLNNRFTLSSTVEGGPNLHNKENNGYASLASSPNIRFGQNTQNSGDINSAIRVSANWTTQQTILAMNAYQWQEDGLKDKGLHFNFTYLF